MFQVCRLWRHFVFWGCMTINNITYDLESLLKSYLGNDNATFKDLILYNANTHDPKDRITISQRDIISEIITCVANACR